MFVIAWEKVSEVVFDAPKEALLSGTSGFEVQFAPVSQSVLPGLASQVPSVA